jgi:hypothetical protein
MLKALFRWRERDWSPVRSARSEREMGGSTKDGSRPRHRPDRVLGDRGYDAEVIRQGLRDRRIIPFDGGRGRTLRRS